MADDAIGEVDSRMRFVKVWRGDRQIRPAQMALLLDGGDTAAWLVRSLEHWIGSWRGCERQLRRAVPTKRVSKLHRAELIQ